MCTIRASMRRHHRTHAVHAHLLEMAGDVAGAVDGYRQAAQLTTSRPEQRYLNARMRNVRPSPAPGPA